VRQEEALRRLWAAKPQGAAADETALIAELGMVMRDASICGLGHTASSAVESALKKLKLLDGGSRR
jgi:NADH-quinone oxidoreductase subunit F